jgi:hypothetical protein
VSGTALAAGVFRGIGRQNRRLAPCRSPGCDDRLTIGFWTPTVPHTEQDGIAEQNTTDSDDSDDV